MNRPKVVLYVGASVDGRISLGTNTTMFDIYKQPELYAMLFQPGEWESFSQQIRELYTPDMFLEGCNMLVAENAALTELPAYEGDPAELHQDFLPEEILHRPGRKTWTSVVDGRGRFRNGYTAECDDPETYMIHLTSEAAPPDYLAFLQERNLPYLIEGKERVDLPTMLQKVHSKLGVQTIATSSGGKLSGALIRAGLLDEINILLSPVVIGGYTIPSLFDSPEPVWPDILPAKLQLIEMKNFVNDKMWLRYRVNRVEATTCRFLGVTSDNSGSDILSL
ncbi:MAG: dihydrofolate reductase family protein, partial [Candidatus Cloacimonadota bacterium]